MRFYSCLLFTLVLAFTLFSHFVGRFLLVLVLSHLFSLSREYCVNSGIECNKDEAARAKQIADKKFKMKDIAGAKKFVLKAQSLYPEMEGVSQMIATFDVYIAAENKVNGNVDWYGILNASKRDSFETLLRKSVNLSVRFDPDRNKFIGAEGAFKHVTEAWMFLSDDKTEQHDHKVSVSSTKNSFCNFAKTTFTTNARKLAQRINPLTKKNNPQKPVGNTQKTGRTDHHTTTTPASFAASGSSDQSKLSTFWR